MLPDGIYRGWVQHSRHHPKVHRFRYPLAMVLLDVDQLESHFSQSRWWSLERFNAISFYRSDYLPEVPGQTLKEALTCRIRQECGVAFEGSVKILTQPRYFGVIFNPVSYYFCYDSDQTLTYIVTEINNTPWNQRHSYVLPVPADSAGSAHFDFDKQFHVSPFMPMALQYHWRFSLRDNCANVHMVLLKNNQRQFDATMATHQQPLTRRTMARLPLQYPMQTLMVVWRIYWQALRLWLKKVPFYSHPDLPAQKFPNITTGDKS